MSDPSNRPGVYSGLRVLDFSMFVAGPYCTRLMADMGAEIVKIEPLSGDFLRSAPPVRSGHSAYFGLLNCGKKSLAIDLKHASGVEIIHRLVESCDVVIENYRPGVMARLGLSYTDLRAIKPDLIYCSVSGYGQDGPNAQRPSFAPIVHAASGFDLLISKYDDEIERPLANRFVVADTLSATHALAGIGAALYHRCVTGQGEYLDVAMMDTMHNAMCYEYAEAQFPGMQGPMVFKPLRTRDGFLVVAPVSQANFAALSVAAGHPEWLEDARFAHRDARVDNWAQLLATIEEWTATMSSESAEAVLLRHNCPASAYRTLAQSQADPQVEHRGAAVEISDLAGSYMAPNCPIQFGNARASAHPDVPGLSQHASEVLMAAGYSKEQVAVLHDQGVLGQ